MRIVLRVVLCCPFELPATTSEIDGQTQRIATTWARTPKHDIVMMYIHMGYDAASQPTKLCDTLRIQSIAEHWFIQLVRDTPLINTQHINSWTKKKGRKIATQENNKEFLIITISNIIINIHILLTNCVLFFSLI